jgi:hypothetical protein
MTTSLETNGTDVIIAGHLRLSIDEAADLADALTRLTRGTARGTTPAKARLMKYGPNMKVEYE